ncbi:MAG: CCA tRNA nucleotidyltransferase [Acholeplasmatales bacterium]|jgi:tRNA nucleotidyltransferase (CCA-adding enzyme)|nr:CCA tRNA nucleotidyltransferase [Acholeplasmatales bacterium]
MEIGSIGNAKIVINILEEKGFEAFMVGGVVRDYLLGIEVHDIDITTNAKPHQIATIFRTYPTGIKFGSVTIRFKDDYFEVTTYRGEAEYLDKRHPDSIHFIKDVKDDVLRRDFTINGLLMTSKEEIIDYVGGKEDIRAELIRAIGNPVDRFEEDALRILRMFYFQSKLGFKIDFETFHAAELKGESIAFLPNERILTEMIKLLKGEHQLLAFKSLHESKVSKYLPGLEKGIEFFSSANIVPYIDSFFILSFYLNGSVPKEWKFDNLHRHKYQTVIEIANKSDNYSNLTLFQNGLENCLLANRILSLLKKEKFMKKEIEYKYANLAIKSEMDLKITNNEILEIADKKPGAWLGKLNKELVESVIENKLENSKEVLISYVKEKLWN